METKGPRGTLGRAAVLELLGALKDAGGLWGGERRHHCSASPCSDSLQ